MASKDRFDALPRTRGRVGAHRGHRTRGLGWVWFLVAVVATAALVVGALKVLSAYMEIDIPWIATPTAAPSGTSTVAPPEITDPKQIDPARGITIIVLNGTPKDGLQDKVFKQLKKAGWPVKSSGNSGDRKQLDTVIYYSNPSDLDVARGLKTVLGAGDIRSVDANQYPGAAITIVIGEDDPLYPKPSSSATDDGSSGP